MNRAALVVFPLFLFAGSCYYVFLTDYLKLQRVSRDFRQKKKRRRTRPSSVVSGSRQSRGRAFVFCLFVFFLVRSLFLFLRQQIGRNFYGFLFFGLFFFCFVWFLTEGVFVCVFIGASDRLACRRRGRWKGKSAAVSLSLSLSLSLSFHPSLFLSSFLSRTRFRDFVPFPHGSLTPVGRGGRSKKTKYMK